jgi:hypothetical protein
MNAPRTGKGGVMRPGGVKRAAWLAALWAATAPAGALTAAEIAARAGEVWTAEAAAINDYQVHFVSVRYNGDGEEEQRYAGYNYFKKPDNVGQELTELYVKGEKRDPNKTKMDSESYDMAFPFDDEYRAAYAFETAGNATVAGKNCYILKFTSSKRTGNYIHGRVWVEAGTYKVAALEASYYKNPKYITSLVAKMWFADFGGRRLLQKLTATGRYSAYLVFTGDFNMVETYDNYRVNVGVPDSKVQ